jgi:eukaryotic translation initiation factor 2C
MVKERIIAWRETSSLRQVPENIIYYRDGVSEGLLIQSLHGDAAFTNLWDAGHYSRVVSEELKAIISAWDDVRKASNQLMGPRTPKITALVGVKRHHTRFYPLNQDDMDPRGNLNCLPGTWVDTVVASPYYQDFYLQSHSGIKGTARPTHYFILRNDGILNCKDINQLRELVSLL